MDGWMDGQLNGQHENNLPEDGELNVRHENNSSKQKHNSPKGGTDGELYGRHENNSISGWSVQK